MSAKSQFLKKLQSRQSAPVLSVSKTQADIAEFRLRMAQLQEQMDAWLVGTGRTECGDAQYTRYGPAG
jgi:beta-phosphoglucomutase-like phosphatase (HAD superfamily)